MRLWHQDLIPLLPDKQLNGQHNECCALRGNGWGRKHRTVDYAFTYSRAKLVAFHMLVMIERMKRSFNNDMTWFWINYRGKVCAPSTDLLPGVVAAELKNRYIYPEHDAKYLQECLDNLDGKNALSPAL